MWGEKWVGASAVRVVKLEEYGFFILPIFKSSLYKQNPWQPV
jgi:hypothetical protein